MHESLHRHFNSTTVQERHRQFYTDIFHACTTVASAPAVLVWSPSYAVGPGGIGIVSKLPLRIYLGIEPTTTGKIEWGPSYYFLPEDDAFLAWETSRSNELYFPVLQNIGTPSGFTGARLWILSEIPWYRGLNVDATISSAVSAAWYAFCGVVTPEQITTIARLPSRELAHNQTFEKIFQLAWRIESIISNWVADGHMTFASLIDSAFPVVFFRERDPFLFDHYKDFGVDHPSSFYNASQGLFFRGARLHEIFDIVSHSELPLDLALVFSGEEGDTQFISRTRGMYRLKLESAADVARSKLSSWVPETFRETPRFLSLAKDSRASSSGMSLYQLYREMSVAHSMTVLKSMVDLFQYGTENNVMREFFDAQNLCQDILRILGLSPFAVDRTCIALRAIAERHDEIGMATRLVEMGNHGSLLVVAPQHSLARYLKEAQEQLTATSGSVFHCHWASWCDGITTGTGVRIDQMIEQGLYSSLTSRESVTVCEWHDGAQPSRRLFTAEKWQSTLQSYDVLLDSVEKKIFIKGEALTSQHIHSAKQTVELLQILFSSPQNEIEARLLPQSCYRDDRNQMESKIVRPLEGIVKKRTNCKLGLQVHGGLGSQYTLQFRPDKKLRIGLVKKC